MTTHYELSERAKKILMDGIPDWMRPEDPFVRKGGSTYLRFDGFRYEAPRPDDGFPHHTITYCWRSHDMLTMRVEASPGDNSVRVTGIGGEIEIFLRND